MRQAVIPEFPLYSITDEGQVINNDTGRVLALSVNRNGVVQVGLMKYGRQYKRGVALLARKKGFGLMSKTERHRDVHASLHAGTYSLTPHFNALIN